MHPKVIRDNRVPQPDFHEPPVTPQIRLTKLPISRQLLLSIPLSRLTFESVDRQYYLAHPQFLVAAEWM